MLARRACVLVVVLALAVTVPTMSLRACDVCPSDCPMHAANVATGHAKHPGCHRAAAPAADGCSMRATCGHTPSLSWPAVLLALPEARFRPAATWTIAPLPSERPSHVLVHLPSPPTGPPRPALA